MSNEMPQSASQPPSNEGLEEPKKPVHSICVDTGPLIKNDPPVSTLLSQADKLYTLPSILDEIRDSATRTRVETTLLPFVELRNPRPASVKFINDFARRTGDLEVMSKPDILLLALTYELELEHNGGDWRLRKTPGQKGINGKPPSKEDDKVCNEEAQRPETVTEITQPSEDTQGEGEGEAKLDDDTEGVVVSEKMEQLDLKDAPASADEPATLPEESRATSEQQSVDQEEEEDSDSDGGWITPSNLKKKQAKDNKEVMPTTSAISLKAALLTSDYAMQNVALRVGLNLLSPSLSRITQVKNWVLRCHGCFQVCRRMDRQFCPSCGQATLTRVSCTTADDGTYQLHLKRNFQWNNRGNVYSIPKPVTGTASGKLPSKTAGGRNGWGTKLMLSEDQKEYERAVGEKRRERKKDLMDEDVLPNILTGERSGGSGRVRLGPGRGINGKNSRG